MILSEMTTMRKLMLLHGIVGGKAVEDFASGNPCVFTTDLSKPLKRLALSLLPRQSGTGDPSPSNIRPLLPWGEVGTWTGGKNLFTTEGEAKGRYIDSSDVSKSYVGWNHSDYIPVKPDTEYVFEPHSTSGQVAKTWFYDADKVGISYLSSGTATFTTPSNCHFMRFSYRDTSYDIQLEVGNTATAYVPFVPITPHPVNLGKNLLPSTEAGTFTHNGITFTADGNGGYTMNGESTATAYVNIPLKQAVTLGQGEFYVHLMNNVRNSYIAVAFMNGSSQVASASFNAVDRIAKIDALSGATFDKIRLYVNGTQKVENCKVSPMICLDSTATPYQPYLPPVYGASVDLTTGEVWGTHALWTKNTASMDNADNVPGWRNSGIRELIGAGQNKEFGNQVMNVGAYWSANTNSTNDILFLRSARYNDMSQSDWQALAIDVQIAVELTTPVLLATLTPQQISALVGVNTVWSDADNVEVTYLKKG